MTRRLVGRTCIVISAVALIAAGSYAVPFARGQANVPTPQSETVRLPRDWQFSRGPRGPMFSDVAISPDGKTIVFGASPDGSVEKALLHVRPIDGPDATVLPGTTGECMPTFSPDGQWIAFWAKPRIQKVSVKGGAPVALTELGSIPYGLAWTDDGRIVFGTGNAGLSFVSASGGKPTVLTTIDATRESSHRLPHAVPGSRLLLFTSMISTVGNDTRVESLSLETGKRTMLVDDAADAQYLPTGHLIFARKGALAVVRFDPGRVQVTGNATTVLGGVLQALNGVMAMNNSGAAQYAVSESGTLIWASGGIYPDVPSEIFWVDRQGRAEAWSGFAGKNVAAVHVSPDGTRVATAAAGLDRAVLVYDTRAKRVTRVTDGRDGGWFMPPFWTPDGKSLAFGWLRVGSDVWQAAVHAASKAERLVPGALAASAFSRDGRYLAFVERGGDTGPDIKILRMSDRKVIPFVATKATEIFPEFSPDGRWLAYVTNESARNEVCVRSFPDGKRALQVSREGGMSPVWGPDGRELFFWDIGFKTLMRVAITPGQNLAAGSPAPLFDFPCAPCGFVRFFDLSPDGRRFLVQKAQSIEPVKVTELHVARNWFSTVRQITQSTR